MKITVLNFEVAEVDTIELPAELQILDPQIEVLEGFLIGKGYSLGNIEWMCHD